MVNDFFTGKLRLERAKKIIPTIRKLLSFARSKGIPIVYVNDSHSRNDPEIKLWGPHAIKGTRGAQVVAQLKPEKGDHVLSKRSYSAFFNTGLDGLLRDLEIGKLLLVGVSTDICIQNTAADAFYRGYDVIIPSDCVEAFDEESHRRALDYIAKVYGAKIITSNEFMRSLRDKK
jgi:nicotinamidase-related amidase